MILIALHERRNDDVVARIKKYGSSALVRQVAYGFFSQSVRILKPCRVHILIITQGVDLNC